MNVKSQRSKLTTKAYRIHEEYKILFEACVEIYSNKSDLILNLMKTGKNIDVEKLELIPTLNKFPLLEKMLDELKALDKPIEELRTLKGYPKASKLLAYYYGRFGNNAINSVLIQTRIFPEYKNFIKSFSAKRLGEVLELAIVNFINNMNDFEYELLQHQAKQLIDTL